MGHCQPCGFEGLSVPWASLPCARYKAFRTQCSARALKNPFNGFRTVTGLNLEYHRRAIRGAAELGQRLAAALENPQETDSGRLRSLGNTLAAFCVLLTTAHHTYLLALSNLLLRPVPKKADEGEEQSYDRKLLTTVCAQLSPQDLAEVLKYPFCTGEAEQIVLNQLESNFAEEADVLDIKDIGSPAQRPSAQDALESWMS